MKEIFSTLVNMKLYLIAALLFSSVFISSGQVNYLVDSIEPSLLGKQDRKTIEKHLNAYSESKTDTARFSRISEMIDKLTDNAVASRYNEYLFSEIEKALKKANLSPSEIKKLKILYGGCLISRAYYLEIASEDDMAMKSNEEALKILVPLNDKKGIASALINIGYLYEKQNKFMLTLEYYQKALKLREEIKEYNGIVLSLSDIGYIHQELGELDTAFAYYKRAIAAGEKHSGTDNIAFAYNNIAG
ncbi:MAG: tetratricopeptide repeat protein, partial [Bacteroidia bacterium]